MPEQLQTALISALVAVFTAASAGFFTWKQIQREREKWLTELKTTWQTEVFKERLKSYPQLYALLAQLSARATIRDKNNGRHHAAGFFSQARAMVLIDTQDVL